MFHVKHGGKYKEASGGQGLSPCTHFRFWRGLWFQWPAPQAVISACGAGVRFWCAGCTKTNGCRDCVPACRRPLLHFTRIQRGPGSSPGRRFDFCATGPKSSPKTLMAAGVATSGHCVVPLLAEDMGGPVGACAHNLVGWSCGGWPRALPRHFCICIHLGPSGPACLQCGTFSLHPFGLACRLAQSAWSF